MTIHLIVFSCRPITCLLDCYVIPYLVACNSSFASRNRALSSFPPTYCSIWIPLVIFTGRDFGPMIIAERLTKVYGRTDGGPGKAKGTGGRELASHCSPKPETPCRWWNMVCCAVLFSSLISSRCESRLSFHYERLPSNFLSLSSHSSTLLDTKTGHSNYCVGYLHLLLAHLDGENE